MKTTLLVILNSIAFAFVCGGEPVLAKPAYGIDEIPVRKAKRAIAWTPLFERDNLSKAEKVAKAMGLVESGGVAKRGASGEAKTIWQWLPATWNLISAEYCKEKYGSSESLPLCAINEQTVVIWKCEQLLRKGYTPKEIGMIWNTSLGGKEKPLVRRGTNKHGVKYDSVHHGNKVHKAYYAL